MLLFLLKTTNNIDKYTLYKNISYGKYANTLHIIKLLNYYDNKSLEKYKTELFIYSCKNGHLDVVKWLIEEFDIDIRVFQDNAFITCCSNGHINIAKFLVNLNANIYVRRTKSFLIACKNGHLNIVQWLSVQQNAQEGYTTSAYHGHLHIVKWLMHNFYILTNIKQDIIFRQSCENGHLNIGKYLVQTCGANIHAKNDWAFRKCCIKGHQHIVKWLLNYGGVNIYANNYEIFRVKLNGPIIDILINYGVKINSIGQLNYKTFTHKMKQILYNVMDDYMLLDINEFVCSYY